MPKIIYELSDGSTRTIEANAGDNVMQVAMSHDIAGILGRCGGFCNCGTCHVYVDAQWADQLPEPAFDEDALLSESAAERQPGSRLGCQVIVTEALDGITVTIPERQEFD
ncbi:MAG: ferredoxin [Verrucomicrobiaceae bacterium]|nr:ferredoxin [Verrucomicrobiaceae bacterium]